MAFKLPEMSVQISCYVANVRPFELFHHIVHVNVTFYTSVILHFVCLTEDICNANVRTLRNYILISFIMHFTQTHAYGRGSIPVAYRAECIAVGM